MSTIGNYPAEIEAILCCATNEEVVEVGPAGEEKMTTFGATAVVAHIDLAPDTCPLINGPAGRTAESYLACLSCVHSMIDSGEGFEA